MALHASDEQTCRLCTSQGANYTSIFRKSDGDVIRMIRCLPVQIRSNDGLPSHICPGCLEALDVSYNLHILCLKANLKLLEKSSSQRTKNFMKRGRLHGETESKGVKKSRENNSESGKDPIIIDAFHFPEALYNGHQDFTKILEPEVKLERLIDNASASKTEDVNHNEVVDNYRCKQEPIDIDEPGPSGQHGTATHGSERSKMSRENSNIKMDNKSSMTRTSSIGLCDAKRTCRDCGRTTSITDFRLLRKHWGRKRVRADACNLCDKEIPKVYKRRSLKDNQPCRSIENMQEAENNEPEIIHPQELEKSKNMQTSKHHSTLWKQQSTQTKSSPKAKELPKDKSSPKNPSCLLCGKICLHLDNLKYHMAVQHTSPEQWKYHCKRCGEKFPVLRDLRRHEAWDHMAERKFVCDLCPQSFISSHGFKLHKLHRHGIVKNENQSDD